MSAITCAKSLALSALSSGGVEGRVLPWLRLGRRDGWQIPRHAQLARPLLFDCHLGLPSSGPRGGPPTVSTLARARPWRPRGRPWPCSQPGRAAAERGQGRSSTTYTIPQELCGVSRAPFTPWSEGATRRARAPRQPTKRAPPSTASPSPAALGRTNPSLECRVGTGSNRQPREAASSSPLGGQCPLEGRGSGADRMRGPPCAGRRVPLPRQRRDYAVVKARAGWPYRKAQERLAEEVRAFGGLGTVHGCIVDVD